MDVFNFDKCHPSILCCELVIKIKQYINILDMEANRLSTLQHECNQLLDKFYASKSEYDYLTKEAIQIKYLGDDTSLASEYMKEFSLFVVNIWQMGKHKFSERGKKVQYMSFVGSPLAEILSAMRCFVDEVMVRLSCMPQHSECSSTLHVMCTHMHVELRDQCLCTADACLRQYVYLQAALPFLQELKGLIHQYLLLPDIHTPKQFVDTVILHIPSIKKLALEQDSEETAPFRFVIDLLNGRLLDEDVLDHNSEIKPVVEDDINLKKSMIVMKTTDWIMQQVRSQEVLKQTKDPIITEFMSPQGRNTSVSPQGSPLLNHNSRCLNPVEPMFMMDMTDFPKIDSSWLNSQRKYTRRSRRTGASKAAASLMTTDLKPIKMETLQIPLLPPLM